MASRCSDTRKFTMTHKLLSFSFSLVVVVMYVVPGASLTAVSNVNNERFLGSSNPPSEFNKTYHFLINHTNEVSLWFRYDRLNITSKAVRVHVKSDNVSETYPVLFVVKQQLGILSWHLPLQLSSFLYWTVRRTLCPVRNYEGAKEIQRDQHVVVDISTASVPRVNVSVMLTYENHFLMSLNTPQMVQASPSEPQYFEMRFPDGIDMLVVSVTSSDDICAIVSIQHIGCPVFDLDKNVQYTGIYQTMTQKAAITIRRKDFKRGRFYIVFVVKPSNYDCTGLEEILPASRVPDRTKRLTVVVEQKISEQNYLLATIGAIVVFILFYIFSITISVFYFIRERRRNGGCDDANMPPMEIERERPLPLTNGGEASYGTISPSRQKAATQVDAVIPKPVRSINAGTDSDDGELDSSVDEEDIDMLQDADSDKNILRTKTFLYVADLARKNCKVLSKKSKLYLWNMLTIAVFYALPVIQLVITYESVLHVTGNQDICYYNFLCTYPLGTISDFNHVFSNVGYVMLGFLFIGLVWRRDLIHKQRIEMDDQYEKYYGIPRHFGLFYAMGIALMMEGLLSGCYHVCPNYSNFQFDTSFMYMIAGLCMLKIYQTRHPDINANAYAAFVAFAIIIFIGVIGVLYGIPVFWVGFAVFHIMSCLALSAQIYYMGRWKLNLGLFKRIYLTMKTDLMSESHCFRPMYLDRMILLVLLNLVNWTFAVYGLVTRPVNFASYLLAIFIVNLLMYVAFYIIMKLRSGEKILPLPLIYIVLSMITWAAALYFFLQKSTTWEKTPAQSRLYNKPCLILDFYDDHDIWHFLSAASMFFSFMILLTLDDDLVYTPRDRIPVF